ncbi:MAG: YkgJ family cysteine cluster protein, partial [Candidatus Thorarchaeota archaeon]
MNEKQKYSFNCLEQKCSTQDCHIRPHVNVTVGDISRWSIHNHLQHVLPGISLTMPENETQNMAIETLRKPLESDPEKTACTFYHEESNGCTIRFARPISCRTFPLEYNGEKYFLSSKNCPGVGEGEITKEVLQEARDLAVQEFKERMETFAALSGIYTMIFSQM